MQNTFKEESCLVLRNCYRCGGEFYLAAHERLCENCRKPAQRGERPLNSQLTFREKQIVDLVCQAKLNKEIAYQLHLTEGTIKEYLNRIFRKLGVRSRTELAIYALNPESSWRLTPVAEQIREPQVA